MFFSNQQLKKMIIPLFMEQLLLMMVGIVDTFVVSYAGEAAVSGVSLVNSFNTIFIYLFTALAAGGAVVVSQYIGRRDYAAASESISQLFNVSTLFSLVMMVLVLWFDRAMLQLLFGSVDPDVMEACLTYLQISAYSYPALAVYNAGAALYRSVGKTSTTMYISLAANVINALGSMAGVFVLHAGVAGVAWPSFFARVFSAAAVTILCFKNTYGVRYYTKWIFSWNSALQRMMLSIAVPNGIESGIFQFVKVALSSVVALFGTYQIAANGIAQSIWSMASLVCVTMGPVFITVIGQCMGAGDIEQAEYYFKKLLRITMVFAVVWNIAVFAVTPILMMGYAIADETKHLVILLVLLHNIFSALAFPLADPFGRGLRAAGDIKFPTWISIFTTVGIRLVFSVVFAITWGMGVIGIAWAMCLDWLVRAIILWRRFRQGKWKQCQVIVSAGGHKA